jgi:hypothetical protein
MDTLSAQDTLQQTIEILKSTLPSNEVVKAFQTFNSFRDELKLLPHVTNTSELVKLCAVSVGSTNHIRLRSYLVYPSETIRTCALRALKHLCCHKEYVPLLSETGTDYFVMRCFEREQTTQEVFTKFLLFYAIRDKKLFD